LRVLRTGCVGEYLELARKNKFRTRITV
jgi:hypothetical protein